MVASSAHSQTSLDTTEDGKKRRWATDGDVIALVRLDCEERGVRCYPYLVENVVAVYNALRKREAIGGDGTWTKAQLARDLYPDVGTDEIQAKKKERSLENWLKLLERVGLVRREILCTPAGKTRCTRVQLLAVEMVDPPADSMSLCSEKRQLAHAKAGEKPFTRLRATRRPLDGEELEQARVRRWCPRAGRGAPRRFSDAQPFICTARECGPRGERGQSPKGTSPSPIERMARCAREGPGAASVDTIEAQRDPDASAALDRRLTAALGVKAAQTLWQAEQAFAAAVGPPSAGRLGHLPTIRQLLWELARLDRYGSFGQGQPGAGLSVLEGLLEAQAQRAEKTPAHLGYFLPALHAEGRRWKHRWAPRIKAARRARRRS